MRKYDTAFDQLRDAKMLTWRPWVGRGYTEGGLLVIGESNYADEERENPSPTREIAVERVNVNWHFTEEVVKRFCLKRTEPNKTFDGVTHILKAEDSMPDFEASAKVWESFAYMDLLQCAMQGKGWGQDSRQRPWKELWPQGWKAVLAVIEVLKPGKLLFVGSGVATNCNRKLLPGGVDAKIKNHRKVGNLWLRTGALKPNGSQPIELIGIPNPGGAHGFSPDKWRDATRRILMAKAWRFG